MAAVNVQQPGATKGPQRVHSAHPRSLGRRDKGEPTQHPGCGDTGTRTSCVREQPDLAPPPTLCPTHTHRAGAQSRLPGRAEEVTAGARSCWGPRTSGAISAASTPDV